YVQGAGRHDQVRRHNGGQRRRRSIAQSVLHFRRHPDRMADQEERTAGQERGHRQEADGQPYFSRGHGASFFLSSRVSTCIAAIMPTMTASSRPSRYGSPAAATATTTPA